MRWTAAAEGAAIEFARHVEPLSSPAPLSRMRQVVEVSEVQAVIAHVALEIEIDKATKRTYIADRDSAR